MSVPVEMIDDDFVLSPYNRVSEGSIIAEKIFRPEQMTVDDHGTRRQLADDAVEAMAHLARVDCIFRKDFRDVFDCLLAAEAAPDLEFDSV